MKQLSEMTPDELIAHFNLGPLDREGGFFAVIDRTAYGSSIVYLMTRESSSMMHRLLESELWVHVAGSGIELTTIDDTFEQRTLHREGQPFHLVAANTWFAARPIGEWSLAVLSLAPPYSGMEMASESVVEELCKQYPEHADVISALAHG